MGAALPLLCFVTFQVGMLPSQKAKLAGLTKALDLT